MAALVASAYDGAVERIAKELLRRAIGRGRRVASAARDQLLGRESSGYGPGSVVPVSIGETRGEVPFGASVLIASRLLRVDLDHFCGGQCSCGTCRVEVVDGAKHLSPRHMNEELVLGVEGVARGDRLACQAKIQGPVRVRVPDFFMVR